MPPGPVSVTSRTLARRSKVGDGGQLALPPDEVGERRGQVGGRRLQRLERGKLGGQIGRHELEHAQRLAEIAQPPLAQVAQRHLRRQMLRAASRG